MAVRQGKVIEARLVREGNKHKLYLFHTAEREPLVEKIRHNVFTGQRGEFRMIEIDPIIKKDTETLFTMRIVGQELGALSDAVHKALSSPVSKPEKMHGIVLYGDRLDAPYTVFTLGRFARPEKIRKMLEKSFVTDENELGRADVPPKFARLFDRG